MDFNPTYKAFGKHAILIEWVAIIDENVINDVLFFKEKIKFQKNGLFSDLIVGYNSLTIKYKHNLFDFCKEVEELKSIYKTKKSTDIIENFVWEIPVCYDVRFGIDLEEMTKKSNLSIEDIIKLHSERLYTIFFIGFLPGFLYLGGLNEQIFFDRKPNPRLNVAKGSVAIGGQQTGVYPNESAGGWNIIGLTPIIFFDAQKKQPCFAKAGDKIKFKPVSLNLFHQIEKEVAERKFVITKTLLND